MGFVSFVSLFSCIDLISVFPKAGRFAWSTMSRLKSNHHRRKLHLLCQKRWRRRHQCEGKEEGGNLWCLAIWGVTMMNWWTMNLSFFFGGFEKSSDIYQQHFSVGVTGCNSPFMASWDFAFGQCLGHSLTLFICLTVIRSERQNI